MQLINTSRHLNGTILILIMLLGTTFANAQAKLGVEVGGGINGIISDDINNSTNIMERAGIIVDVFPKKKTGILYETGVYYIYKGYNMSGFLAGTSDFRTINVNMNRLEIPFMFGRVYHLGSESSNSKFIFKGGIYVSCGIDGKGTAIVNETGTPDEKRISNVFKSQSFAEGQQFKAYNRFDLGLRLGTEFLIKDYSIRFSYSLGALQVHSSYGNGANSELTITFGCFLL